MLGLELTLGRYHGIHIFKLNSVSLYHLHIIIYVNPWLSLVTLNFLVMAQIGGNILEIQQISLKISTSNGVSLLG